LQCVAVCCSMLKCVAHDVTPSAAVLSLSMLQYVAVCCSGLQWVAVGCSGL